ncbi:MAG: PKD domain-containing protein [Candidatus Thermoplasmatota archaeon]
MGQQTKTIVICCLCILFCIGTSLSGIKTTRAARSIYVDDSIVVGIRDGSANKPYETIQYAHDVAQDGDVIYVFEGVYNETLKITKQISIIGLNKTQTILQRDGPLYRYLVEITAPFVTLENLTLTDPNNKCSVSLVYATVDSTTIQSCIINRSSVWAIYFASSNDNTIGSCWINNTRGVNLVSSNNNVFSNNNISWCSTAGVQMMSSTNNIFYNNTFYRDVYGVFSLSGTHNITKNTFSLCTYDGIKLSNSPRTKIINNMIKNCKGNGINLDSSEHEIKRNKFTGNQIGMLISGSDNFITYNYINNSKIFGVSLGSMSKNNIFSYNRFYKNKVQVQDTGRNQWYNEERGNYWDDYTDGDRNHDGIGDIPYNVSGSVQDRYPLGIFLKPPMKPTNPSPKDGAENVGLSVTLSVRVRDNDSSLLTVYFYHATDDELVGVQYNVQSGKNASCSFRLPFETSYPWYAVVSDGKFENRSDIFIFTTRMIPPTNQKPVANPGGPYTAAINQQITFNGSQSRDPDGKIDFYRWNFGDGSSEILSINPQHTYLYPGIYTVTLTVIDNVGQSNIATTTVTVLSSIVENQPPIPRISTQGSLMLGEYLIFSASNSTDPDGSITNYSWSFGDGTRRYGSLVTHKYSQAGSYTVILKVTDDAGAQQSTSIPITIQQPKGFPGFELLIFLAALTIILSLRKKIWQRKK